MKIRTTLAVAVATLSVLLGAYAQQYVVPVEANYRQVTIGLTPVALEASEAFDGLTRVVLVSVHGAAVRVRFDGENPTQSNGHLIRPGSFMTWDVRMARAARFVRAGDVDAVLAVTEGR